MKKKRFSVEQIVAVLKQAELGVPHDINRHASYVDSWITGLKKDKNEQTMLLATITMLVLAGSEPWARWLLAAGSAVVAVIHAWIRGATGRGTPVWEPTRRPADTVTA